MKENKLIYCVKLLKLSLCLVCLQMYIMSGNALAELHLDYFSWHSEPVSNYYCSQRTCIEVEDSLSDNETCVIDSHSCPETGYKIIQNDIRDYWTANNIKDSRIAINQDSWRGRELDDLDDWNLPQLHFFNSAGKGLPLPVHKTDMFRFYVPPGTSYLSLNFFCPLNAHIAVVARLNQLPCENGCPDILTSTDYYSFPYDWPGKYTIRDLISRNIYLDNSGGDITIFSGGTGNIWHGAQQEGGWLYIKTLYSNSFISMITYNVSVNVGKFKALYDDEQRWDPVKKEPLPSGTVPDQYRLTINTLGTGTGTVTSNVGGIVCSEAGGADCSKLFNSNTSVRLTALAGDKSTFVGWSGACSGNTICELTMREDKTVTATFNQFEEPEYSIKVTKTGNGKGTITSDPQGMSCGIDKTTCYAEFESGIASVVLTAVPDGDSEFTGWGGDCGVVQNTCTVDISQKREVTTNFQQKFSNTHTVTAWAAYGGQITSEPVVTVRHQGPVSFTVEIAGAAFKTGSAVGNCPAGRWGSNQTVYTIDSITEDCQVFFNFVQTEPPADPEYTVTARLNDLSAGILDATSSTIKQGQPASFTIQPKPDYAIQGVTATGNCGRGSWFQETYTTTPDGDGCALTFNLLPAAWYDLYRNLMIVPCLYIKDGETDTYWRALMRSPTGGSHALPYLIFDDIPPIEEGHGLTPQDCAQLNGDASMVNIPCYTERYNLHCSEMELGVEIDSIGQLILQLQPVPNQ